MKPEERTLKLPTLKDVEESLLKSVKSVIDEEAFIKSGIFKRLDYLRDALGALEGIFMFIPHYPGFEKQGLQLLVESLQIKVEIMKKDIKAVIEATESKKDLDEEHYKKMMLEC